MWLWATLTALERDFFKLLGRALGFSAASWMLQQWQETQKGLPPCCLLCSPTLSTEIRLSSVPSHVRLPLKTSHHEKQFVTEIKTEHLLGQFF